MTEKIPLSERLGSTSYVTDRKSHLRLVSDDLCRACVLKPCIPVCPAGVYEWDLRENRLLIHYENCLETGACRVACLKMGNRSLFWSYPEGGKGVRFRLG